MTKQPAPYPVRISAEIQSQLKMIAQAQNVKPHALARQAIEEFVRNSQNKTA